MACSVVWEGESVPVNIVPNVFFMGGARHLSRGGEGETVLCRASFPDKPDSLLVY